MADQILYELSGPLALITLNKPASMNALSTIVLNELSDALDRAAADNQAKAVIITSSSPKVFCAGADIKQLNSSSPDEIRKYASLAVSVFGKLESSSKPTIAAINAHAFGGGLEMAEACMLRLTVPEATMGHPEVRIGAVSGWGGSTRLPRLIGKGRAAELLLTGRAVSANEALAIGLVNAVVPANQLLEQSANLAHEIISNAPQAVALSWQAMHEGLDMTLEQSLKLGIENFGQAAQSDDFREGTGAFIDKCKANYKGR